MPVMGEFTAKEISRFWAKVEKKELDDCWLWLAGLMGKSGYGQFSLRCFPTLAHRVSFQMEHAKSIEDICVLHSCDNRRCVNPAHLFLGTYKDNSDDMKAKGRERKNSPKGERHNQAKLRDEDIPVILELFTKQATLAEVGTRFGISTTTACKIRSRKLWKHISIPTFPVSGTGGVTSKS